jgi:uncharacterized protein (DUF2141 family)
MKRAMAAAVLAAISMGSVAAAQPSAGLVVDVEGLRSGQGLVDCYVYAAPDGFPADPAKAARRDVARIVGRSAACHFANLPPGAYAVAVVHDENGNGRLDRNFLGIPTEGVGASNDAEGHFGPPKFAAARFNYAGGAQRLVVHVRYLL